MARLSVAVISFMVLAACGGGDKQAGPEPTASVVTMTTTSSSTTSTTMPPYPHVSSFEFKGEDGYNATLVLRRGEVVPARTVTVPTACPLNPQTDAVVPFQLSLANTTTGFASRPSVRVLTETPTEYKYDALAPHLRAVLTYAAGPTCTDLTNDSVGLSPTTPLAPGEHIDASGWFLIGGYYTPATPEGQRQKLRDVLIGFAWNSVGKVGATTGAVPIGLWGVKEGRYGVPLDATSDGGCLVSGRDRRACGP